MATEKEAHDPSHGPRVTPVHVGGDSFTDRILPHIKTIGVAALALGIVLTGFFTWRWWSHRKAEEATNHLARALELGDRPVQAMDINIGDKPPEEHFKTEAERAKATLAELAKAGQVRGVAGLYEAHVLLQAGRVDEALSRYRALKGAAGLDGALAREGIGIALEAKAAAAKEAAEHKKLLEDALAAFQTVQTDDKGPRRDYGLYHEARVLESLGKPAEAVAALKKALAVAPDGPLKPSIEVRLSALGAAEGS